MNSPLNAESCASLAFITILGLGSTRFVDCDTIQKPARNGVAYRCAVLGQELLDEKNPVIVKELPNTLNCVFFLHNGFRDCVAINSGQ